MLESDPLAEKREAEAKAAKEERLRREAEEMLRIRREAEARAAEVRTADLTVIRN